VSAARIVIAGGGVAGLGAALALAQRGWQVTVIERRARVGGIHRGDSLLPKSVEFLEGWGVRDALHAAGARPIFEIEVHAPGSSHVLRAPLTARDAAHPYLVLPHAKLEHVLMERALATPGVQVIRPASVVDLLHDESGRVTGIRYRHGEGEHEVSASLVVAADGQHSVVRKRLDIAFEPYRYDHAYLGFEADRPQGYRDAMRVHFHAEGGVLLMPHPQRIGVGILVDAGSAREWLTLDEESLRARVARRAPILEGVKLHLDGAHVYELTRAHAERYVKDGVALIGDAAHVTNPTAGQGMAMALTDAGVLADCLGECSGAPPSAQALSSFARVRDRNERLVRRSHWLALAYGLRGRFWTQAKLAGLAALANPALQGATQRFVDGFLRRAPAIPIE
jgi:2-polyprenyl-6-methoxyphenol hydroxylase-like FAD-dependent oxidoreductase